MSVQFSSAWPNPSLPEKLECNVDISEIEQMVKLAPGCCTVDYKQLSMFTLTVLVCSSPLFRIAQNIKQNSPVGLIQCQTN